MWPHRASSVAWETAASWAQSLLVTPGRWSWQTVRFVAVPWALAHWRGLSIAVVTASLTLGSLGGAWVSSGPSPDERLDQACAQALEGDARGALTGILRALAEADDDDHALRRRGLWRAAQLVDLQLGDAHTHEAIGYYRQLIESYPGTPEALLASIRSGELLEQRLGRDRAAEAHYAAVAAAAPHDKGADELLLRAARLALDGHRPADARAHVDRLLERRPDAALARAGRLLTAASLHLENRHTEAAEAYVELARQAEGTPEGARAWFEAGVCEAEQGHDRIAEERYLSALTHHPDPDSVQRALERVRRRLTVQAAVPTGRIHALGGRNIQLGK